MDIPPENIVGRSNLSSSSRTSQKDSQESVIYLGEYDSTGVFVETVSTRETQNGAEEITDIADELSQNMHSLSEIERNSSTPTSNHDIQVLEDDMEITEFVSTGICNQTTMILSTQQPVWNISIVPLSDSSQSPPPESDSSARVSTVNNATTTDATSCNIRRTDEVASEISEDIGMGNNLPDLQSMSPHTVEVRQATCDRSSFSSGDVNEPISPIPTTSGASRTPLTSKRNVNGTHRSRIPSKRRKASTTAVSQRSVSSTIGSVTSVEDGQPEPAIESDPNTQITSIHRICVETVKSAFGRRSENCSEFQLIEKIIEKSNNRVKDTADDEDSRSKGPFQRRENFRMPTLDEAERRLFSGEDFNCEIYVQETSSHNNFLLGYGLREKENSINCLVFYYRRGDIFALTTRHAWNAIQWCSDYDFPSIIAARLLNPEGQLKSTDKELIGNVRMTSKTRKTCEGENPLDINRISTHYVADFRRNCSIFKFRCFHQNPDLKARENVKVEVGFAYIRILKRLSTTDFLCILDHLSLIYKGETTCFVNSGNVEKDSKIHSKNLTMVSNELSRKLDSSLVKKIYDAFHNSGKAELNNYDFCHKDVEDYSLADNFSLFIGKERACSFPNHPTLAKIIDFMLTSDIISCKNLVNAKTFQDFEKKFSKFKIGYGIKGRDKQPEKILNFVEGDILHTDGRLYCKLISKWHFSDSGYFAKVHFYFKDILEKHLMNIDSFPLIQLQKPWPSNSEIRRQKRNDENYDPIQEYVDSYREEENFYIPEKDISNSLDESEVSIKLFDMMAIGAQGEIFIHFIQDGFNAKIRDASTQIKKALNKINTSNFGNSNTPTLSQSQSQDSLCDSTTDPLKQFYELCCDDNLFCQRFPDFYHFKSQLKNATIVFSIADPPEDTRHGKRNTISNYFQPTNGEFATLRRSFSKERDLGTKLSVSELVELLEGQKYLKEVQLQEFLDIFEIPTGTAFQSKVFAVAKNLYELLRELKYIDRSGVVTSKLLLSSEKRFEIKGLENHLGLKKAIYNVINAHQSQYKHLIPKLAVLAIKNEVLQAGYQFKISEIPTMDI